MKHLPRHLRAALYLVLALLLLCAVAGCRKDPKKEMIPLFANGMTEYSVVRPEVVGADLREAAAALATTLADAAGIARFPIREDYVARGESVPTDTLEILVGLTNRQESIDAHKTLKENQYLITMMGKRLVIVGYDEAATVAAIQHFKTVILTEHLSDKTLSLLENFRVDGLYVPPVVNPFGEHLPIFPSQNSPTTSISTYLPPTYTLVDGMYVQSYPAFALEGVRTTFQANTKYDGNSAVYSDSVMVYSNSYGNFASWYASESYVVDMMIAVNRCSIENTKKYKLEDSIQTDANGNYLLHGTKTAYYMVPSEALIEYVWDTLLEPVIIACHPQSIALEEPEMWNSSGYSEAFRQEWVSYFEEPWQDPASSAENNLKANLLKTYLFERMITELAARAKALDPNVQIYVASHSTVNYSDWGITSGLDHYIATGVLDGIIGQTWSDTHNTAFPYRGTTFTDNFTNAFIEYSSYIDSVEGINFYALADPMADGTSYTEENCQYFYRQSIAATLLQPEIHRFQILPWVQRAFSNVSSNYRTIQSQIYRALNELGGQRAEISAGTPGITYLVSDSMSWMQTGDSWALKATSGVYGVTAPLIRDGIPAKMKSMEHIHSAKDLEGVTLLLVSFDTSLPLQAETNEAIAEWVKAGGTLLFLSGSNEYWDAEDYFFWAEQGSPLNHLLECMDLQITTGAVANSNKLSSHDSALDRAFDDMGISTYRRFAISFEGAKTAILSLGDDTIGIDEAVGKGRFIAVGLPSAFYTTIHGPEMVRALVKYALQYTEYEYVSSELMVARRGNVVAAHAYNQDQTLPGVYLNLYSADLHVLTDPTIKKDDSMVLYDISDLDRSVPRLAFSGGKPVKDTLTETAELLTYEVTGAANTLISNRILLPSGVYPATLEIKDRETGNKLSILKYIYDSESHSVLFVYDSTAAAATIRMTFGSDPAAMNTVQKVLDEIIIMTSKKDLDLDYLIKNTAGANDGLRFCDGAGEVVYRFDYTDYLKPVYQLYISQNYIVEISPDGEAWTMIADYSQGGTVPRIANADNATTLSVDPAQYEQLNGLLYIRIRNTQSTGGHGGAISKIVIRHLVDAEQLPPTTDAPGTNNTTQEKIPEKVNADESRYLISTSNGISTYRRTVKTNSDNEDEAFIDYNTAGVNTSIRYCDGASQLIYAFDISEMTAAKFTFYLSQNYLFEISLDGKNYQVIADYSKGGTVPHLTTGGNEKAFAVNVFDYAESGDTLVFFRLRNTDPSQGWGGTITRFVMEYQKPAN